MIGDTFVSIYKTTHELRAYKISVIERGCIMKQKISVIVPIYNAEDYLGACLDSILCQTYRDFELLLIDDGSPDGCGKICDEYSKDDERIRVFHQSNQGVSSARNLGLSKSTGEFVLFVDSDDTIHSDLLSDVVKAVKKHGVDIVIFHYQAIDTHGKILYSAHIDLLPEVPFTMETNPKLLMTPASLCNKFIRKSLFNDFVFPPDSWYEDLWMTPRIYLRAENIVYIGKKPLYNYLLRPGSIMHSANLEKLYSDRTKVLRDLLTYFKTNNLFEKYKEELEALTIFHGYFYASLETLLVKNDHNQLAKFRTFIESEFVYFRKNSYLKKLNVKEKIQFTLLLKKQYNLIRILTFIKNFTIRIKDGFRTK